MFHLKKFQLNGLCGGCRSTQTRDKGLDRRRGVRVPALRVACLAGAHGMQQTSHTPRVLRSLQLGCSKQVIRRGSIKSC